MVADLSIVRVTTPPDLVRPSGPLAFHHRWSVISRATVLVFSTIRKMFGLIFQRHGEQCFRCSGDEPWKRLEDMNWLMPPFKSIQRVRAAHGAHSLNEVAAIEVLSFTPSFSPVHYFIMFPESRGRSVQCKAPGCGSTARSQSTSECTVTWRAAGSV